MKWQGQTDFIMANKAAQERLRVEVARASYESAKKQRDYALANFGAYGIHLITGRSRALYAIQPGEGMFTPGASRVSYEVGYVVWPDHDHFSPTEKIPFYPWYLNYGTARMAARPFHTVAVEATEPFYVRRMDEAFAKAMGK